VNARFHACNLFMLYIKSNYRLPLKIGIKEKCTYATA